MEFLELEASFGWVSVLVMYSVGVLVGWLVLELCLRNVESERRGGDFDVAMYYGTELLQYLKCVMEKGNGVGVRETIS